MPDDIMTTAAAAAALGLSHSRLRSIVADGYRPVRGRLGREWLWSQADVDALRNRRPKGLPTGDANPNSRAAGHPNISTGRRQNITKAMDELTRVSQDRPSSY